MNRSNPPPPCDGPWVNTGPTTVRCLPTATIFPDQRLESSFVEVCDAGIALSTREVNQRQFSEVMGFQPNDDEVCQHPNRRAHRVSLRHPEFPATCVSFDEVQQYLERINRERTPKLRLPTSTEWEAVYRWSGSPREELFSLYFTEEPAPDGTLVGMHAFPEEFTSTIEDGQVVILGTDRRAVPRTSKTPAVGFRLAYDLPQGCSVTPPVAAPE